jgi:hypothetical protein
MRWGHNYGHHFAGMMNHAFEGDDGLFTYSCTFLLTASTSIHNNIKAVLTWNGSIIGRKRHQSITFHGEDNMLDPTVNAEPETIK